MVKFIFGLCCLGLTCSLLAQSETDWEKLRQKVLNTPRRIIYNNDGCDLFCSSEPIDGKEARQLFLEARLNKCRGTQISTISYCAGKTHKLIVPSKFVDQALNAKAPNQRYNLNAYMHKDGIDVLETVKKFCHDNDFEFFIALRMNDVHDSVHRPDNPYFWFSSFKEKNPKYLFGTPSDRLPYGAWSGMDFAQPAVRILARNVIAELVKNYQPDGIELDFCRNFQFFKSTAMGAPAATQEETQQMTQLMLDIRNDCELIGRERGRPVLIAARLPDSAPYCKALGVDLEQWLKEKLIDIYIGGFSFKLNPWETSVELAHKYGAKFYAGLTLNAIQQRYFQRMNLAGRRGREAGALGAGVDGLYYFNYDYASQQPYANMRGNLDDIRLDDKDYFVDSYFYVFQPSDFLEEGERFNNMPGINHLTPALIAPGTASTYYFEFGDDLKHPALKDKEISVKIHTAVDRQSGELLNLMLNDHPLRKLEVCNQETIFAVNPEFLRLGINQIKVAMTSNKPVEDWVILKGNELLTKEKNNQSAWRRLFLHPAGKREEIIDDSYRIADVCKKEGEMANLLFPLYRLHDKGLQTAFELLLEESTDPLAVCIRLADGKNVEIVSFEEDKINLHFAKQSVDFRTNDKFHQYDVILNNGMVTVNADGKTILQGTTPIKAYSETSRLTENRFTIPNMHTSSILIGSLSGSGTGSARWKNLRLKNILRVKDIKISLQIPHTAALEEAVNSKFEWDLIIDEKTDLFDKSRFKNLYGPELLSLQNGAWRFRNSKGYDRVEFSDKRYFQGQERFLIAQCKIRKVKNDPDLGFFSMIIKAERTKDQAFTAAVRFFPDKIWTTWGSAEIKAITDDQLICTVAIDLQEKSAIAYLNGKIIISGSLKATKPSWTGVYFGDSSSTISGETDLTWLKFAAFGHEQTEIETPK